MSDDEDDYMSADILAGVSDKPQGIAKSRAHQRQLNIHARFEESRIIEKPKRQTLAEKEKERRDEALAKPISHESKGFALMAKMGFKPGMTLGKKRESDTEEEKESDRKRLKVPISIEIKEGRKGLGHEKQEIAQRNEKVEAVMKDMKERAAKSDELIADYKIRRRNESTLKEVLKDVWSSRKVCEELDHRLGNKIPKVAWFWRSYAVKNDNDDQYLKPGTSSRFEKIEEEKQYKYSNGLDAPEEVDFNAIDEESLRDRLEQITIYLRTGHFYCVWCGSVFDSPEDLKQNCPGDTRHAHHGLD